MNDNINGSFKKKKIYFTQVSNNALRDNSLSLKAKGLYATIQSYVTLENFTLYKSTLEKQCSDKKTSFDTAWKELKNSGYLLQLKSKNNATGQWIYQYDLLDTPYTENPGIENPGMENPPYGKPTPGKPSMYNNTDLNNTDLNNTDLNNTSNIKKERKNGLKSYEEIVNNYTNNEKLRTEIFEFIKMRKLIKSPMTDKALNLMINKLNKLSNNNDELKISILDQSIENSWKGIFELKDVKSNGVITNNTGNIEQSSIKPKYDFSDI